MQKTKTVYDIYCNLSRDFRVRDTVRTIGEARKRVKVYEARRKDTKSGFYFASKPYFKRRVIRL